MQAKIYSTVTCPWCVKAKSLLLLNGVKFKEIIINSTKELSMLEKKVGRKVTTVPQIFIEGFYVGGYKDLVAYFKK